MSDLSHWDHVMIAHAKARGPVAVTRKDGHVATGRLVAWRPDRRKGFHENVARVLFPSGKMATVKTSAVTPLDQ